MTALRVLTYNILVGGEDRIDLIAGVIAGARPDLVALQEASDRGRAEVLAKRLGMELAYGEANPPLRSHVAWLSRLPFVRVLNHPRPEFSKTLLEVEVVWQGETVRLFASHLVSRHEIDRYPRVPEAEAVLEVLRERGGDLHLIAGDFNALTPGDPAGDPPPDWVPHQDALPTAPRDVMRIFGEAGYADCFRQLHRRAAGYTYTAQWPWLRLDRILASPTLARRCVGAEVLNSADATRASDHLPLLVTFQPDDAAAAGE